MGGDVLGVSVSGLIAAQRNLSTTGHNIANANTEGYSRQKVDMVTRTPQPRANGAIGQGVIVNNVARVYSDFVTAEVWENSSLNSSLQTNHNYTSQVDNLLSDPNAGLAPALQSFFAAVNGVADDPASASTRQVLLSEGKSLAQRFDYLDTRINSLRKSVNKDTHNVVGELNEIAQAIADLNNTIVKAREIGGGTPSDLLDQRDKLIGQLSTLVTVRTTEQEDGRMNVFIGNGQSLVVGSNASHLIARNSRYDPDEVEILFKSASGAESLVTRFLTGGKLGGILEFKNGVLDTTQNELGRIAIGIAKTFNEQHRRGMDLDNKLGADFFFQDDGNTAVAMPLSLNKGNGLIQANITDIDKLTVSDYQLDFRAGQYRLIRLMDNELVGSYSSLPINVESEGLSLSLQNGGSIVDGDSFIIRPTRMGSSGFDTVIHDVNKIAAASPLRTETSVSNLGSGKISAAMVDDVNNPIFDKENNKLAPPFVIRFVDDTHFEILDNTGNAIPFKLDGTPEDPVLVKNEAGEIVPVDKKADPSAPSVSTLVRHDPKAGTEVFPLPDGTDFGFKVRITGTPMAGDEFKIEFNTDGIGDNSNAVALAKLQDLEILANETASYSQSYSQMVSRVGSKTHELEVNKDAQELLLNQSIDRKEAVSGVNLDEEAANMVKYQKLYQANAQGIATSNKLLDELLNAFR